MANQARKSVSMLEKKQTGSPRLSYQSPGKHATFPEGVVHNMETKSNVTWFSPHDVPSAAGNSWLWHEPSMKHTRVEQELWKKIFWRHDWDILNYDWKYKSNTGDCGQNNECQYTSICHTYLCVYTCTCKYVFLLTVEYLKVTLRYAIKTYNKCVPIATRDAILVMVLITTF